MFRGNSPATIDEKGRLKIPSLFRKGVPQGRCFVTSIEGDSVRIYPMVAWLKVERKIAEIPSVLPARQKFLDRVNYFGQEAKMDKQGRILIQPILRESASMQGEVVVLGMQTWIEVWNRKLFVGRKLKGQTLTREDYEALAEYGI